MLVYLMLVVVGYVARMVHEPLLRWAYASRPRPALDITPAIARAARAARERVASRPAREQGVRARLGEPPSLSHITTTDRRL